eukprot:Gb_26882 [translate_table: standard]
MIDHPKKFVGKMDHFNYSYGSDDGEDDAVEELLSQFLDEDLLKITTHPVGRRGSADYSLDYELETRYEKLKASVSKSRPVESNVEQPEAVSSGLAEAQLSPKGNNLSSSARSQWDSNSSSGDARKTSSSSRTFMASPPSPSLRSISPPPPKSCFCGSPKKLLRSLSSRRSSSAKEKNKKSVWSDSGSVSPRFSRRESQIKQADLKVHDKELMSVISGEAPMRVRRKGKDKDKRKGRSHDECDSLSDEEFLTDLSTFSLENQEKQLKKAVKEEHRVNRDAEDLVKWVKQASARIDASIIDDLLSDDEELK